MIAVTAAGEGSVSPVFHRSVVRCIWRSVAPERREMSAARPSHQRGP
jgi:hypothetical protein